MRKRNIQTNIRMTDQELKIIKKQAKQAKLTFSEYMISSSINKNIIVIDDIKEFTKQLSKVGNNLNQLTLLCHQGRITSPELSNIKDLLQDIYKYLISIRKGKKRR